MLSVFNAPTLIIRPHTSFTVLSIDTWALTRGDVGGHIAVARHVGQGSNGSPVEVGTRLTSPGCLPQNISYVSRGPYTSGITVRRFLLCRGIVVFGVGCVLNPIQGPAFPSGQSITVPSIIFFILSELFLRAVHVSFQYLNRGPEARDEVASNCAVCIGAGHRTVYPEKRTSYGKSVCLV